MTDKQKYKLRKAITLITNSLDLEESTNPKILSVQLSVASDYCKEIANSFWKENRDLNKDKEKISE